MIEIIHKGSQVILKVDVAPLGYFFNFSYDCGSEWSAKALHMILSQAFRDRIQYIRGKEYRQGVKDARKKKTERKDWFDYTLDKS